MAPPAAVLPVVTSEPVVEFDHHSAGFAADPIGAYRELRERCPVAWTDAHGGYWVPTRYDDINAIARDDATFSSARSEYGGEGTAFIIPKRPGMVQIPLELDPPESLPYRRLLNPILSPPAVERLAPVISRITAEAIDRFIERGRCDFVADLANPVPACVTLEWLGFPTDEWERFALPLHDIFAAVPGSDRLARGEAGLGWIHEQIRGVITERRARPRDDAVSFMVAQQVGDRPVSDDELSSVIFLVILGGVDTTTSLTAQTLVYLDAHPDARARLAGDERLVAWATEEFLRVFAPSQAMARTVTADVEVSGCPMHRGDRVLVPWVAANFDPAVFDQPDDVIFERSPNRHTSFGAGVHRCAGAHLARAMFKEMVTQVLARLGDYQVERAGLVAYPSRGNQTGWDAVPATFTPRPRRTSA
jgi:cytochrome P450